MGLSGAQGLGAVTSQNVDKPKRRQPKRPQTGTSTNRNATNQNVYKPKRRQTKRSTNQHVDKPKHRQTDTSTNRNVEKPKRWQTETSTNKNVVTKNFSIILKIHCIWYVINTRDLTKSAWVRNSILQPDPAWYLELWHGWVIAILLILIELIFVLPKLEHSRSKSSTQIFRKSSST